MRNRVFFPQAALDAWVAEEKVDLANDELTIRADGRRYKVVEAVRVLREVSGAPDVNDLCGRVKSKAFLHELEGEMFEASLIIGDNAYDVVPGFVGAPIASPGGPSTRKHPPPPVGSDEDLLAAFLAGKF